MPQGRIQPLNCLLNLGWQCLPRLSWTILNMNIRPISCLDAKIGMCLMEVMDIGPFESRQTTNQVFAACHIRLQIQRAYTGSSRYNARLCWQSSKYCGRSSISHSLLESFLDTTVLRLCMDSRPVFHRPVLDASLHKTRHWQQLEAAGYHTRFLLWLQIQSQHPSGLVIESSGNP